MVGFVATRSEARPVSYKADTYSAAAIFWKLLSGETPPERHYFDAHTGLPRFVRVEVLRRLPASDQLFGILQKSLALEPNNRANSGQIAAFIADYAAKLQQKQF
jgi:serine/threonine protein kinase